ncbi:MAG: VanW family protein [Clostridia bacterium]|nr:VanW family protein [Clostridia bacterium]
MNYQQGYRPPQAPAQPPRKKNKFLRALLVALGAAAAVAAIALGVKTAVSAFQEKQRLDALAAEVAPYQSVFLPNIYLDDIPLGGMTAQEGIDAVVSQIQNRESGWSLALTYQSHVFYTLHYSDLDVSTDISEVYAQLEALYKIGKLGTVEEKKAELDALRETPVYEYTMQSDLKEERLDNILEQIRQQLTYDPADAYLAYFRPDMNDPFIIQDEQYGSSLDTSALKAEILARASSGSSGSLEIHPDPVAPKVTKADVRRQVALRSKATTPVSSASTEDRTNNIRTAFSYLNGQVVQPGAKLSFNKVAKERTLANGYKYAIEYISGMEEMGIGGGVCQASTTLYLAALKSKMEIVSRISHSDPVSYTTFGQDATVYWNRYDLVIRNTADGPIYITAKVVEKKKNSYECQVCIYGPSLGDGVSYALRTETVETIAAPLSETYVKDTSHTYVTYKDEEPYLLRKARDGFVNVTYLQKWVDGELIEETFVSRDTCKERETVYLVGTLDPVIE